jgi:choline dehydrogenase-like flavoprotein
MNAPTDRGSTSDFDVLIIGSGFGGSVAALRLIEKGYRVGVLEAGRRFADADFPKTSWRVNRFLFAPKLGLTGIQRIHRLKDVVILAGAGVGGGSLVYANTLYVPPQSYFDDPQWSGITNWRHELSPWYDQASRMLGVVANPYWGSEIHSGSHRLASSSGRALDKKVQTLSLAAKDRLETDACSAAPVWQGVEIMQRTLSQKIT